MKTILLAAAIAFAVTAAIGMPVIHWLRKMKFGQKILEIGPKWHMNKQNIPTMGGLCSLAACPEAGMRSAISLRCC